MFSVISEVVISAVDEKHIWCLYNQADDQLLEGLTFSEARSVVSVFKPEHKIHWFAWREGWEDWKPVAACYELTVTTNPRQSRLTPPALPRNKQETATGITTIGGGKKDPQDIIVRKHTRYQFRLKADLICNGRTFSTYTEDISLGGLRLERTIPDWVAGYSTLVLTRLDNYDRLEFLCTVVENQTAEDKTRLEILPSANHSVLESWLALSNAPVILDEGALKKHKSKPKVS